MGEIVNLRAFALWCIETGPWEGRDLDGGEVQKKATELGLMREIEYEPKVHGESDGAVAGDIWFEATFGAGSDADELIADAARELERYALETETEDFVTVDLWWCRICDAMAKERKDVAHTEACMISRLRGAVEWETI